MEASKDSLVPAIGGAGLANAKKEIIGVETCSSWRYVAALAHLDQGRRIQ
jgi:hypothetical protein